LVSLSYCDPPLSFSLSRFWLRFGWFVLMCWDLAYSPLFFCFSSVTLLPELWAWLVVHFTCPCVILVPVVPILLRACWFSVAVRRGGFFGSRPCYPFSSLWFCCLPGKLVYPFFFLCSCDGCWVNVDTGLVLFFFPVSYRCDACVLYSACCAWFWCVVMYPCAWGAAVCLCLFWYRSGTLLGCLCCTSAYWCLLMMCCGMLWCQYQWYWPSGTTSTGGVWFCDVKTSPWIGRDLIAIYFDLGLCMKNINPLWIVKI
jgi:hypothetical protein